MWKDSRPAFLLFQIAGGKRRFGENENIFTKLCFIFILSNTAAICSAMLNMM
jgi:hypothetical protein